MTSEQFKSLKEGDIIRFRGNRGPKTLDWKVEGWAGEQLCLKVVTGFGRMNASEPSNWEIVSHA